MDSDPVADALEAFIVEVVPLLNKHGLGTIYKVSDELLSRWVMVNLLTLQSFLEARDED